MKAKISFQSFEEVLVRFETFYMYGGWRESDLLENQIRMRGEVDVPPSDYCILKS